jgi:Ca2+-binding RTX toxin-like protein
LEALEPRLLLSADLLSAAGTGNHEIGVESRDVIRVLDTADYQVAHASSAETIAGSGPDLFADMGDEALPGGAENPALNSTPTVTESAPIQPAADGAAVTAPVTQTSTSTTTFSTDTSAATTLGTTAVTGQSDALSDQLTTTLTAANGPPAGQNNVSSAQISATSTYNPTDSVVRARAASVDTSVSGSNASPTFAAAPANYAGDHNFSGETTTINITGKTAGQFDVVAVTGHASLGGVLTFNVSGYTPVLGDTLVGVFTYASSNGDFDSLAGYALGGGLYLKPVIGATGVNLVVVNEVPPITIGDLTVNVPTISDRTTLENVIRGITPVSVSISATITLSDYIQISGTLTFSRTTQVVNISTGLAGNIGSLSAALQSSFDALPQFPTNYLTSVNSLDDLTPGTKSALQDFATAKSLPLTSATQIREAITSYIATELFVDADLSTIHNVKATTITLAASNVNVFIGVNGGAANPNALGLSLTSVNLGAVIMSPATGILLAFQTFLPKFYAIKGTAATATLVGVPEITASATNVEVDINSGFWSKKLSAIPGLPIPTVNFQTSFPISSTNTAVGFEVPTGGTAPIRIDFNQRLIHASATNITLQLSNFVYFSGSLNLDIGDLQRVTMLTGFPSAVLGVIDGIPGIKQAFEGLVAGAGAAGLTISSDYSTISGLEVRSMKLGLGNATAFVGIGGPPDSSHPYAVGLTATGVDFAMALMSPTLSALPGFEKFLPKFYSVKAHVGSATVVGLTGFLTFTCRDIDITVNDGTWGSAFDIFPAGTFRTPAINFAASFPVTGNHPTLGFQIPLGNGNSLYLDYTERLLSASAADAEVQISTFIYIRGSFFFKKGPRVTMGLTGGLTSDALTEARGWLNDNGLGSIPDPLTATPKTLDIMTIGASHVHAFVGLGGPYWLDSNNDGRITSADTTHTPASIGLAIDDLTFGMAILTPLLAVDPGKYYALKATAKSINLVGIPGVSASANDLVLEVNQSSPSVYGVSLFPVVDFTTFEGGKYVVSTGGKDSSGNPITVDLAMNSALLRAQGFVNLSLLSSVYLSGNITFEMGPRRTVNVTNLGTTTQKTVTTLAIGFSHVNAFIGVNGPYWTDSGNPGDHAIQPGELSSSAIGFSINDFTGGLVVMASINTSEIGAYVGMKAHVASFGLVNMPLGLATANATFDIAINIGPGVSAVNFATSFPATSAKPTVGYKINTGDPNAPVYLAFTGPLISFQLTGKLTLASIFELNGTFLFDMDSTGLRVLADASLTLGSANLFNMQARGVLVINSAGIAADLEVTMTMGVGFNDLALANASARVVLNTTGADQTVAIPEKYLANLSAGTIARLTTDSATGVKSYLVKAGAPKLDGTYEPPASYLVVLFDATLTILGIGWTGHFRLISLAHEFEINADAVINLKIAGTTLFSLRTAGSIYAKNGTLAGGITCTLESTAPIPGFTLGAGAAFEVLLNTSGNAVTLTDGQIIQSGFVFKLTAEMTLAGSLLKLNGTFEFKVLSDRFSIHIDAQISIFGSSLWVDGIAEYFYDANPGLLFLIQLKGANGGPITVYPFSSAVGSLSIGGTFTLGINTTGTSRTVGLVTLAASTARIDVTATVNMFGFTMTGGLTIIISNSGLTITIPQSSPLSLNFFGLASLGVYGTLTVPTTGAVTFSFTASAGFSVGDPDSFGMSGNVSVTFSTSGFSGSVSGKVSAFGLTLLGATGTITITSGQVKLSVFIEGTLFPAVDIDIELPWPLPDIHIHTPAVTVSATATFVLGTTTPDTPPPAPDLATLLSGGVLRLNLGTDVGARGSLYPALATESYIVKRVGPGSSSGEKLQVIALGFVQEYDNVSSILVNNTLTGNDYIEIASGVVSPVTITIGSGNSHIKSFGSGAATINGGTGGNTIEVGNGGGTYTGGRGLNTVKDHSSAHILLVKEPNFTSYTLSDSALAYGTNNMILYGVKKVELAGGTDAVYAVAGWTGVATLIGTGTGSKVQATTTGNMTLTDSLLTDSTGLTVNLTNIKIAELSGNGSNNTFTITGWTGSGSIRGAGGVDTVVATNNLDFTLSDSSLARSGRGSMTLHTVVNSVADTIEVATLSGGSSANTFTVSSWTGTANLLGGDGADTYTITLTGAGSGTIFVTDSGSTGSDALTINGTAGIDGFVVTGTVVTLASESVTYSGVESLTINGAAGADTFTVNSTSITSTINGGQDDDTFTVNANSILLTLNGDAGADTMTIAASAAALVLSGGSEGDTFNLKSHSSTVSINTGSGAGTNTINIGSAAPGTGGNVNGIDGKVTITGDGTSDVLNVDDSGDAATNAGLLTSTRLTGLGMADGDTAKGIEYTGLENLNITLGTAGDDFTIESTSSTTTTVLNTEGGADRIAVKGTSGLTTVNAGGDGDVINVGSLASVTGNTGGTLNAILGALTVNGGTGTNTLTFDDTGDSTANTGTTAGTLTSTQLTGLGLGASGVTYGGIATLNLNLGGGGDTLTIASTHANLTQIEGRDGDDQFTIRSIAGRTEILGQEGSDTFTVGDGTLGAFNTVNGIDALLVLTGGNGTSDTLNVTELDEAAAASLPGTLTLNHLSGLGMSAPGIDYTEFEALNVTLGAGGDTFNVQSTNGSTLTTINTGSGSGENIVNVGSLAPATGGNVNAIAGKLVINGQSSSDTVNVDDRGDSAGNTGLLTSNRLTGLGMAGDDATKGIEYSAIETLNLSLGAGADDFTIQSTHAGVTVLNTLGGADRVAIKATSGTTTVNSGDGNDTINVGSLATVTTNTGGNLDAIQGALTVNGGADTNSLTLDETGDATPNSGTMTSTQVTGLGMGAGGITYSDIATLNINLGTGGDTFNVQSTNVATLTTLKTGSTGANIVNVGSLTPTLGGNLNAIAGKLVIDGQSSSDTINVDDTGDSTTNTGELTGTQLTGLGMGVSGIEYANIEFLNINLGTGGDTFVIVSTHVGQTTVSTGGGADNVYIATLIGETRIRGQGGDDTIKVNVNSTGAERQIGGITQNGVGALLDINGGDGSDHNIIYLAGRANSSSHPVSLINVSDNTNPGTNTLDIYGTDVAAVSDNFLIRRNFIALIPAVASGATPTAERINYDSTINGNGTLVSGVTINGRAGGDYFAFDDNSTTMTVDGGDGDDIFQVGQMFQSQRVSPNVAGIDETDTVHTTRGFLTRGVSKETTINGGGGNDQFTIFSNQGKLHLFGDAGDDAFVVRAFALYGSVVGDPDRARTNISAGLGTDYVEYNVNAPVTVDGGDGSDKVVVVGTEFGDHFIITSTGVTGAGLSVTYTGIELLEIDGMEGNDRFTVLSTLAGVVTRIFGGLGSDLFEIGGDPSTTSSRTVQNVGGPLILEGGVDPTANRSLANPLLYLNETNPQQHIPRTDADYLALLNAIEAEQVDSLWVYNNDVLAGQVGTLTHGLLSGLGMPTTTVTLGTTAYPGGITYLNLEMISVYLGRGNDTFEVLNTHGGTSLINGGDGNDTINVRTVLGHTTVQGGVGDDHVILGAGASALTIDRLRALVTIDGGGGTDAVTIDDRADANNNVGTLDATTLAGLDLIEARVRTLQLGSGLASNVTFTLTIDGRTTTPNPANNPLTISSSLSDIRAALVALGLPGVSDIVVNRAGNFFTFSFLVDEGHIAPLAVLATVSGATVTGVASTPNRLQTISVAGDSGTFTVAGSAFTISANDDANTVRDAIIARLPGTVSVKDVVVSKFGNSYEVMFQGVLAGSAGAAYTLSVAPRFTITGNSFTINAVGGTFRLNLGGGLQTAPVAWNALAGAPLGLPGITLSKSGATYTVSGATLAGVDDTNLIAPIAVESRNSGVNYYDVDVLNLQLGSGSDVVNIRGTSAVTNVFTNDGNDRVYVSSLANETEASAATTDFLLGNLDRIVGTLNLDLGAGRHVLMISDEAAIAGDGAVRITDQTVSAAGVSASAEIKITGLSAAPAITYKATLLTGNFADGITIWTGWGADTIVVDGTHQRGDGAIGSMRTITTLNTGLGDDKVTVSLESADGFFVLNTQGPYNGYTILSDKDTVNASTSSRPLIIFGGQDNDDITGGSAADIIFGDRGLVTYYNGTAIAALLGKGGPGDRTDGIERFVGTVETTFASVGGNDIIKANDGNNVVLGGQGNDDITAGTGTDVIIGDGGVVNYDSLGRLATIQSDTSALGGNDTISGGDGKDFIIGGIGGDTVSGQGGNDLILGDNGRITFAAGVIASATTLDTDLGAGDTLGGNDGDDWIIGGALGDVVSGGAGNDVILGDFGLLTFNSAGDLLRAEPLSVFIGTGDTLSGDAGDDILIGGAGSDRIDGGTGNDLIAGDNAVVDRTGRLSNFTNPLFATLSGSVIYDVLTGEPKLVDADQIQPGTAPAWGNFTLTLLDSPVDGQTNANRFGNDYLAGGAGNDRIFGGLGNDVIQGDGSIIYTSSLFQLSTTGALVPVTTAAGVPAGTDVGAWRGSDKLLYVRPSFEDTGDGDDYIEGNGGDDVIFGGLGQDDIVGGSSNLFGLDTLAKRPDGSDLLFGGAGTQVNRENGTTTGSHARDADTIAGDNANIFRPVSIATGNIASYLTFAYDNYAGGLRLIPRAVELLDYTPGGTHLNKNASADEGAADEVHGEAGDDTIYGQKGEDVLYGDAQDDDIIGGVGHDWISGGNGDDGILGDDGRIFTSRNGLEERLYGIAAISNSDLNDVISTPGQMQIATINVAGKLKKTALVEPFLLTASPIVAGATYSDDIIFGGLGDDAIHGGVGDDALSGAEALPEYFAKPFNPGNILGFGKVRPGEFAAYNEYSPLTKIFVNAAGEWVAATTPSLTAFHFILNFSIAGNGSNDGDDVIFGDVGNDWLVGGTGRDHLYGGYGDDLMNGDDNHDTNGGKNDIPDTNSTYEDLAYGGAGRDILIGNTGGDRLIDWAGEFNSYLVPFAPFGAAAISRAVQPGLMEFLYALSESDGADPTRAAKTANNSASAVARNGEPSGELGLVKQSDFDWQSQTGAPNDPQPGNIPGGSRDVLRSATFNTGTSDGFAADSGTWTVTGGRLQVSPTVIGGDAVSVFYVDSQMPRYFELQATINAVKPTGGFKANAYLIFDYQSPTDFKFAGIDIATDKLQIGHRNATGWIVDTQKNMQVRDGQDYNMLLAINGTTVTLVVDNSTTNFLSFAFSPRVIDGYSYALNTGMVGIGANNSRAQIDNVAVRVLPPTFTFTETETFADGKANLLTEVQFGANQVGQWTVTSGRNTGTPATATGFAASNFNLQLSAYALLQFDATVQVGAAGSSAGVVFDYYDANNFKFAALVAGTNQVVIGHHTKSGWTIDATANRTVNVGTDYLLSVVLKGTTVSVNVDGQAVLGYVFNSGLVDGQAGLFTRGGASSFDGYTVKTDDAKFAVKKTSAMTGEFTSSILASSEMIGSSLTNSMNELGGSALSATAPSLMPLKLGIGLQLEDPDLFGDPLSSLLSDRLNPRARDK